MTTYREIVDVIKHSKYTDRFRSKIMMHDSEFEEFLYYIVSTTGSVKRNTISTLLEFDDYVAFDFETTGLTYEDEIIQLSAVKVIKNTVVEEFNVFVKPKNEIPWTVKNLTGITNEMVMNSPSLDEVIDPFMLFIQGFPLIGHNITSFDFPRFEKWAGIDLSIYEYVDTLQQAKVLPLDISSYTLESIAHYYDLKTDFHNALNDSIMTHLIYQKFKNKDYVRLAKDSARDLTGLKFCITGKIGIGKSAIEAKIKSAGGKVQKSLSKQVHYLICGPQVANNIADKSGKSRKELEFEALVADGHPIQKFTEDEFLSWLVEE